MMRKEEKRKRKEPRMGRIYEIALVSSGV